MNFQIIIKTTYKITSLFLIYALSCVNTVLDINLSKQKDCSDTLAPALHINQNSMRALIIALSKIQTNSLPEETLPAIPTDAPWTKNTTIQKLLFIYNQLLQHSEPITNYQAIIKITNKKNMKTIRENLPEKYNYILLHILEIATNMYLQSGQTTPAIRTIETALALPGIEKKFTTCFTAATISQQKNQYKKSLLYFKNAEELFRKLPQDEQNKNKYEFYSQYFGTLMCCGDLRMDELEKSAKLEQNAQMQKAYNLYTKAAKIIKELKTLNIPENKQGDAQAINNTLNISLVHIYSQLASIASNLQKKPKQINTYLTDGLEILDKINDKNPVSLQFVGRLYLQMGLAKTHFINTLLLEKKDVKIEKFLEQKYFAQFLNAYKNGDYKQFMQEIKDRLDSEQNNNLAKILGWKILKGSQLLISAEKLLEAAEPKLEKRFKFDCLLLLSRIYAYQGKYILANQAITQTFQTIFSDFLEKDNSLLYLLSEICIVDKPNAMILLNDLLIDQKIQRKINKYFKNSNLKNHPELKQLLKRIQTKKGSSLTQETKQSSPIQEVLQALKKLKNSKKKNKQTALIKWKQKIYAVAEKFVRTDSPEILTYLEKLAKDSFIKNDPSLLPILSSAIALTGNPEAKIILLGLQQRLQHKRFFPAIESHFKECIEKIEQLITFKQECQQILVKITQIPEAELSGEIISNFETQYSQLKDKNSDILDYLIAEQTEIQFNETIEKTNKKFQQAQTKKVTSYVEQTKDYIEKITSEYNEIINMPLTNVCLAQKLNTWITNLEPPLPDDSIAHNPAVEEAMEQLFSEYDVIELKVTDKLAEISIICNGRVTFTIDGDFQNLTFKAIEFVGFEFSEYFSPEIKTILQEVLGHNLDVNIDVIDQEESPDLLRGPVEKVYIQIINKLQAQADLPEQKLMHTSAQEELINRAI
ncbi:MAG: hypothetical protein DRP78_02485 [Candidatus Omnitrophota bacterium]|nr:MAG: hypothetical protein DRP78_02485 [Candidatus Omnitrophota bacterium]